MEVNKSTVIRACQTLMMFDVVISCIKAGENYYEYVDEDEMFFIEKFNRTTIEELVKVLDGKET